MGIFLITLLSLLYPQNEDKVAINVPVYHDFKIEQYLGVWYEYARLDHTFERDLDSVYVEYKKDGENSIKIRNNGYNNKNMIWKTFEGRIKITESPNKLKVSFIPFVWNSFEILYYDCDYKYAIVTTGTSNVLWIMSRTKNIPPKQLELMLALAEKAGFDTSKLIFQN